MPNPPHRVIRCFVALITSCWLASAAAQTAPVLGAPDIDLLGSGLPVALQRQADGKVLVGGQFTRIGSTEVRYLARLLPDGEVDTDWMPQLPLQLNQMALASDGMLYLSYRWTGGEAPVGNVLRIDTAGSAPRCAT